MLRRVNGQFSSGNSGRPKGSRNKATIAIESLLKGQAEALTQTVVAKALEGDSVALRLCMERIAPAPKDQPVSFSIPEMNNALDASEAAGSVLTAVSTGELTPIEATRVMGLIDSYRRSLELTDIEERAGFGRQHLVNPVMPTSLFSTAHRYSFCTGNNLQNC